MEYLCDHIYRNPLTGKAVIEQMHNGKYRVDEELFQLWKREMLSKMLVAGARTAIVLNSVLHHREGMEQLHGGTAMSGVDEGDEDLPSSKKKEGRHAHPHHGTHGHGFKATQGLKATGINMSIFFAILVVFRIVMRRWRGKDATEATDRA